jgi:hypothetical protein
MNCCKSPRLATDSGSDSREIAMLKKLSGVSVTSSPIQMPTVVPLMNLYDRSSADPHTRNGRPRSERRPDCELYLYRAKRGTSARS